MDVSAVADWISIATGPAGLVLGVVGIVVAVWQLKKTRSAAEAALRAAKEASAVSVRLSVLVSIARITRSIGMAVAHAKTADYRFASSCVHDATNWLYGAANRTDLDDGLRASLSGALDTARKLDRAFEEIARDPSDDKLIVRGRKKLGEIDNQLHAVEAEAESLLKGSANATAR